MAINYTKVTNKDEEGTLTTPDYSRGPGDGEGESKRLKEVTMQPSTIETIDFAIYDWLNEKLDIHTTGPEGWKKVPVLWVTPERAFQIKNDKLLRDNAGNLKLPLITVNRVGIAKDPTFKGVALAHLPEFNDRKGGSIRIARTINAKETAKVARNNSVKKGKPNLEDGGLGIPPGQRNSRKYSTKEVVYDEYWAPQPVYVACNYEIVLRTEYQQQINHLMSPFISFPGQINVVKIKREGHAFEAFIQQDFASNHNVINMGEEERSFETKITIKVLGHIMGSGDNRDRPQVSKRKSYILRSRVVERTGKLKG